MKHMKEEEEQKKRKKITFINLLKDETHRMQTAWNKLIHTG